jgi:hypothetical protein
MCLWNRMFAGRIAGGPLLRTKRSLAGHSALQLFSDLLGTALFERVSASPPNERARANDRQGLHLFILESEQSNARAWFKP